MHHNARNVTLTTGQVSKLLGIGDLQLANQEKESGIEIERVPTGAISKRQYRPDKVFDLAAFRRGKGLVKSIRPAVVAVYNAKGGVGKSTSSVELAIQFQAMGYRVLVVDTDPQGNATVLMGYDPELTPEEAEESGVPVEDLTHFHFGHLFSLPPYFDPKTKGRDQATYADLADVVKMPFGENGPHLIPADFWLQDLEFALHNAPNRDWLVDLLVKTGFNKPNSHIDLTPYDIVIFDCPPSASLLTRNVLIAADLILAPTGLDKLSVKGMSYLAHLVAQLQDFYQRTPPVLAVPTRYQKGRQRAIRALNIMQDTYGELITEAMISESEAVGRNQGDEDATVPLSLVRPQEKVAGEYRALALELVDFFLGRK